MRGNPAIKKGLTILEKHLHGQGGDRTSGHASHCICRPCRRTREKRAQRAAR